MTKPEGPYYVRWDGLNWLIHDPQEPEIPFVELDIELLTDRLNKQHAEIERLRSDIRALLERYDDMENKAKNDYDLAHAGDSLAFRLGQLIGE